MDTIQTALINGVIGSVGETIAFLVVAVVRRLS